MKTIRILVGIPCSGKSTYSRKEYLITGNTQVISRDWIRENDSFFGLDNPYIYSKYNESKVTKIYDRILNQYIDVHSLNAEPLFTIILDNTHCKEKYIDEIITKYGNKCHIEIKFFEISLLKAHYRNIIRRFRTGKWIPIKVMNTMYKNFNKINRNKYKQYIIN